MLTCHELVDFLADYLDGNLPTEQAAEFRRHLKICPPCEAFLKTYEETIRMGKAACCHSEEIPEQVPEQLVHAILEARKKGS